MTKLECQHVIQPIIISKIYSGYRLDQALSNLLPDYSRSKIKKWILSKKVKINKRITIMPDKTVSAGELIEIDNIFEYTQILAPENIPLNIIYEDDFIIIINKAANFVVHPGAGNDSGTLLNALLFYYPDISLVPRAGIVHRLDKDTTGLMLVAKDVDTQIKLTNLLRAHKIIRKYEAIVYGIIIRDGTVDIPIARHFLNRTCMFVHPSGKSAVTHYQVIENFSSYTRVQIQLETGRTHQIRVHMAYIKHPVIGDKKYGKSQHLLYLKKKYQKTSHDSLMWPLNRQALHASMLRFIHPVTGILMTWNVPLPLDMLNVLSMLRVDI